MGRCEVVTRRHVLACCLAAMGLTSAACASRSVVVLATYPNQETGAITVSNAAGSVELNAANQFTALADPNVTPTAPAVMDEANVRRLFGKVLAMEPSAPIHFVLRFGVDSTDLLPDSAALLPEIVDAIRQRGSAVVSIIGHSDTFGDRDYNSRLSLRRAEAVKNRLVAMGIAEAAMEVASHGEENPLIRTGDNVQEERNRRVEVVVR